MNEAHPSGDAVLSAGARHRGALRLALALTLVVFGLEAVTAVLANSLALLSDAGHMLTDVAGLGMALAAIGVAARAHDNPQHTFGLYRLEILAALANTVLLLGVAGFVIVEAILRFSDPPDVAALPVLVVAAAGLAANLVSFALLRRGAKESLTMEGALLDALGDTMGSAAVIVAAIVIETTGWTLIDPIIGVAIGALILPRTVRLAARALRILLQAAPPDLDVGGLRARLAALPGVVDVHDLHVWTLTSSMEVASAHLMIGTGGDAHAVLDQARALLRDTYSITHATLQVEPDDHEGCTELAW